MRLILTVSCLLSIDHFQCQTWSYKAPGNSPVTDDDDDDDDVLRCPMLTQCQYCALAPNEGQHRSVVPVLETLAG